MGSFPTRVLKNNFGEQTTNWELGGSAAIECNFIVDSTNGNGFGVRSLKQNGIKAIANIFMHTSATPATGNPNPASGYIVVKFLKAFTGYVCGTFGFVSPVSGTPINVTTGLTLGGVYTIVSVGTTTAAQWNTLGLPVGAIPAVGSSFVALTASAGVGTGAVEVPLATGSGITTIEAVGDPTQTINVAAGGTMILQCLAPTNSTTTTQVATAPAAGSVVSLTFVME